MSTGDTIYGSDISQLERKIAKPYDIAGLNGSVALFTVTGSVIVRVVGICKTGLVGGQNIEVGIAGQTDAIIATTLDTDLDADDIWHDASPDSEIEVLSTIREYIITDGNDILITSDGAVTSGDLIFLCFWQPLEGGSTVVAT